MIIPVIDHTGSKGWSSYIQQAIPNWNQELSAHGRAVRLAYRREGYAPCGARVDGAITVCDSEVSATEFGEGGFDYDYRPWKWGYVSLYMEPAAAPNLAVPLVVHELGHCLGLSHVADGSDSVMTVHLTTMAYPSASDCGAILPYLDTNPSTPVPPPTPTPKHKKKHKKKH
jgi:hypothetical protein